MATKLRRTISSITNFLFKSRSGSLLVTSEAVNNDVIITQLFWPSFVGMGVGEEGVPLDKDQRNFGSSLDPKNTSYTRGCFVKIDFYAMKL